MIIEGIITTENEDGSLHIAPIGPHVDRDLSVWQLKPFQSSTTFKNLHRASRAVFHNTDNALLLVAAVLSIGNQNDGRAHDRAELLDLRHSYEQANVHWRDAVAGSRTAHFEPDAGWVLRDSTEYFALRVTKWDTSQPRAVADCIVAKREFVRPFWGWNRAKHSLLELAVVVSRIGILDANEVRRIFELHSEIVHKTGGPEELLALELLSQAMSR